MGTAIKLLAIKVGEMSKTMSAIKNFLAKKELVFTFDRYIIKALSAMAQGLFASLLTGLIIRTIGEQLQIALLIDLGTLAMSLMGPAVGVAIALSLKAPPLVLYASAVIGAAGASFGGPAGAFVATVIGVELGKLVSKETKLDILVTPAVTLLAGYLAALLIGPSVESLMNGLGASIVWATEQRPLIMGIVVATMVGLALTAPISSAALAIMLGLSGLAAGAATAGASAQMIGFAVMSFRENRWGGLVAQGLGTSMLQIPNIVRNPWVLLPPTLAGMVTGPLAITVWQMENISAGAGMGTSGLVGQISTLTAMGGSFEAWSGIVVLHFLLPALLTILFAWPLYKWGKIKPGNLKLEL